MRHAWGPLVPAGLSTFSDLGYLLLEPSPDEPGHRDLLHFFGIGIFTMLDEEEVGASKRSASRRFAPMAIYADTLLLFFAFLYSVGYRHVAKEDIRTFQNCSAARVKPERSGNQCIENLYLGDRRKNGGDGRRHGGLMDAEVSRGVSLMIVILTCVGGSLGPCEDSLIAECLGSINLWAGWVLLADSCMANSWVSELKADTHK